MGGNASGIHTEDRSLASPCSQQRSQSWAAANSVAADSGGSSAAAQGLCGGSLRRRWSGPGENRSEDTSQGQAKTSTSVGSSPAGDCAGGAPVSGGAMPSPPGSLLGGREPQSPRTGSEERLPLRQWFSGSTQAMGDVQPKGAFASPASLPPLHNSIQVSSPPLVHSPRNSGKSRSQRSNFFFTGDTRQAAYAMRKGARKRASGRVTTDSNGEARLSVGSHASLWGVGSAVGSRAQSDHISVLGRLAASLVPGGMRHMLNRSSAAGSQLSGFDLDDVGASAAEEVDLQRILTINEQMLKASARAVHDKYQQSVIQRALGGESLAKRATWMNRVLGTLYTEELLPPEEDEDGHEDKVLLHPHSPFMAYWDGLIAVVNVYHVAVVPLRVVWGDHGTGLLFMVEMVLCMLLLADVILSFHTGLEKDGMVDMDRRRVRRRYLFTWFLPELVSSMPWDLLALMSYGQDTKSYRSLSLSATRFLGLLHWPRLWRSFSKWQDMIEDLLMLDTVLLKLLKYWLGLIMFVHSTGCLIALQAFLQRNNPNSFFNRTNFTSPPGEPPALMQRNTFTQYTYSLFRSTSGLLAVGYGMSKPVPVEEVWMMLAVELAGASMRLVFQASILTLTRTYYFSRASYMQRMEALKDLFTRNDVPDGIRKRVATQMMAMHTNRRIMREESLMKDLAPSMRADLRQYLAACALKHQPLFRTWRPVVVRSVAAELEQGVYARGDTVFCKGELADCMFLVAEGSVCILDPDANDKVLARIGRGGYFGEFALLEGERATRSASAQAITTSVLLSLSRRIFYRIAAHYPEMLDSLSIIATARAALNRSQTVDATELLRIKNSRASVLMSTCRAAVATAIAEEEDGQDEAEQQQQQQQEMFDVRPAVG